MYCAEIIAVLRTLKKTRDMSVAEVKLVVSIEDPRTRERRSRDMEVCSVEVWRVEKKALEKPFLITFPTPSG
jgi:hypothetical protein